MLWDSFKFELKQNGNYMGGLSLWIKDEPSGHIIALTPKGIYREPGLTHKSGFVFDSNDEEQRVRFLRGNASIALVNDAPISTIKFDFGSGERTWGLWKNDGVDAVTVRFTLSNGLFKRALLLTPAGVYRYTACVSSGLPVDGDGRLQVMR